MPTVRTLFVGVPLDVPIAQLTASCPKRDRVFLEDPAYLQSAEIEGTTFLGRRVDAEAASASTVEDCARNVRSLIARVAPQWPGNRQQPRVIAVEMDVAADAILME